MEKRLWFHTVSQDWMEGLPIGNGRLAAMVWGDTATDRISLNHEWLWRGVNRYRECPRSARHLAEVRKHLKDGEFFHATSLANLHFGGLGGKSGLPGRVDSYQPAGDLSFQLKGDSTFLSRELDIENAVQRVERRVAGVAVHSEFIAHVQCNLIMCAWSSNAKFSGTLTYQRAEDPHATSECRYTSNGFEFVCAFEGGIEFVVKGVIRTNGVVAAGKECLHVNDATEILAFIDIGTSVKGIKEELACHPVPSDPWMALRKAHEAEFSALMGRVSLELAGVESGLPTDRRLALLRSGTEDPSLPLLFFNYGRYLLASSSICGELPANLQGKWNDRIDPPWECDYHFDINLQMNYWMAESANMPECVDVLVHYLESFLPEAKAAAEHLYGCRGIYLPLLSDAWGRPTPEAYGWAVWVGAAPWMAQHIWRHYEFSGDLDFLEHRAYPFFKNVAAFFEDYLVRDSDGVLQVMPSQSPENRFTGTGSWPVSLGISSAMDIQLIHDTLSYAVRAATLLGKDKSLVEIWEEMLRNLPAFSIGSDGRLLEWDSERNEVEPGHRHLSHLYGLYPSDLFNPIDRPEHFDASVRSLEYRLMHGGGHTGWSRAWVACLYARIGDGKEVWTHLCSILKDFTTASLLDIHPPCIFQIDGNLGAVEAILQSLVQSWGGKTHLLRALPPAWERGRLERVKVPGGHTLTLSWSECRLETVEIELGYCGRIVLSGLEGKFKMPTNAAESGGDVILSGLPGTRIVLAS
jgi:alpha-L-fucosidase 2